MLTLLSPAKTFTAPAKIQTPLAKVSQPSLFSEARPIIEQALSFRIEELGKALKLSNKLAVEAHQHWQRFLDPNTGSAPASLVYSGMVFKKLGAKAFNARDWEYASEHLRFTSFVYGLLSPLDTIKPYRMEGNVHLAKHDCSVFEYWRDYLTPLLIDQTKQMGGVLCFLASEEMKQLFHWAEVERAVRVIYPTFLTRQADGSTKQIVIYTKMARGLMARAIMLERIEHPEELKRLMPEGFIYHEELSSDNELVYILN